MFIVTWLFDKLGYMPKISVDTVWSFPTTQKNYESPEFGFPVKKPATKKPKVVAKTIRKKKA